MDTNIVLRFFSGSQYKILVLSGFKIVEIGGDKLKHKIFLGHNGKVDSVIKIIKVKGVLEESISQRYYYKSNGQLNKIVHYNYSLNGELYKVQLDTIVYDLNGDAVQFCSTFINSKKNIPFRPSNCISVKYRDSSSIVLVGKDSNCRDSYNQTRQWCSRICQNGNISFCVETSERGFRIRRYFDSLPGKTRLLILEEVYLNNQLVESNKGTSDSLHHKTYQYDNMGNLTECKINGRYGYQIIYTDLNLPSRIRLFDSKNTDEKYIEYHYYR